MPEADLPLKYRETQGILALRSSTLFRVCGTSQGSGSSQLSIGTNPRPLTEPLDA